MKKLISFIGVFYLYLISYYSFPQCISDFSYLIDNRILTVEYFNQSSGNENNFIWIFNDTDTIISTKRNKSPLYQYSGPGLYKTCLISQKIKKEIVECSDTACKEIALLPVDTSSCYADFIYESDGNEITFYNRSNGYGKKVLWNFGDFKYSKNADKIKHRYKIPGEYDVTLIIFNDLEDCFDQITKTVSVNVENIKCSATFFIIPDNSTEMQYTFASSTNSSENYFWDFGDGNISNSFKTIHKYYSPGNYNVRLTVSDPANDCFKSSKKSLKVSLNKLKLKADFEYFYDIDSNLVYLRDASVANGKITYYWNFGDNNISTVKNPVINLNDLSEKEICLTIYDKKGNYSTTCKQVEIYTSEAENAEFQCLVFPDSNSVKFSVVVEDTLSDFSWDFGDGSFAEGNMIIHEYSDTGIYLVHLQKFNDSGMSQSFQLINVHSKINKNIAGFILLNDSDLKASTSKTRPRGILSGDISRLKWSFGDGTSDSTSLSPVHEYDMDIDSVNLCLTVYNDYDSSSKAYCKWLKLNNIDTPTIYHEAIIDANQYKFSLYPNPVKDRLNFTFYLETGGDVEININDLSGKIFATYKFLNLQKGKKHIELNMNEIRQGIYIARIITGSTAKNLKFIKMD